MSARNSGARARGREAGKRFHEGMRAVARDAGFGKRGDYYWRTEGPFFLSARILPHICARPSLDLSTNVKTLRMDDVYWEVMGMGDNRREPMSLRAWGVWITYGDRTVLMPDEGREVRPGVFLPPELRVRVQGEADLVREAGRLLVEFASAAGALLDSCGRDEGRFYDHLLKSAAGGFPTCILLMAAGRMEEARDVAERWSARWRPTDAADRNNFELILAWIDGREGEVVRDGAL